MRVVIVNEQEAQQIRDSLAQSNLPYARTVELIRHLDERIAAPVEANQKEATDGVNNDTTG